MEDSNETFQFNEKHFQFLQEQAKGWAVYLISLTNSFTNKMWEHQQLFRIMLVLGVWKKLSSSHLLTGSGYIWLKLENRKSF